MTKRTSILILFLSFMAGPALAQTSVPPDTLITLRRFADAFNNGTDSLSALNNGSNQDDAEQIVGRERAEA